MDLPAAVAALGQQLLPVIEGTLIRLTLDRLPGDRSPEPLWLWTTAAATTADAVDRTWQAFLRRFNCETYRTSSPQQDVPARLTVVLSRSNRVLTLRRIVHV